MTARAPWVDATAVPRLGRGVRLKHDEARGLWILLAPERMLELDDIAHEIVKRVDGKASLADIAGDLAQTFAADRDLILQDVTEFIDDLIGKRIVVT